MNKKDLKQSYDRMAEIAERMRNMCDSIESEKREFNENEKQEFRALEEEKQALQFNIARIKADAAKREADPGRVSGEERRAFAAACTAIYNKRDTKDYPFISATGSIEIPKYRDVMSTTDAAPMIPITIGDIVEPLEKGLILEKVGVKMQTGIVGDWMLPVVTGVEATIEGENVAISDTKIPIAQLKSKPKRVTICIPVSNTAIKQTNFALLNVVTTQMSMALTRVLNKWMFSPTKLTNASDGVFVKTAADITFTTAPTYENVIGLKSTVLKKGVQIENACYVCGAEMYGLLETTPKVAGDSNMILQDGKINGFPVFITEYVGEDFLGFGAFAYALVGQFGAMQIVVDPYTKADANITRFVLNADFDMLAVRPEAFAIAKKSA